VNPISITVPSLGGYALLVIFGLLAVHLLARLGSKKQPSTPAQPGDPTPTPAVKRPAPAYLGALQLKWRWYGFGQRIIVGLNREDHACSAGGVVKQTDGIVDNGSGPYDVAMEATDTSTGKTMPVYTLGADGYAGDEVTGTWVRVLQGIDALVFYALGRRPWEKVGALVNCDEFVPLTEYADKLPATSKLARSKAAASKATATKCGCGSGGGSTVSQPARPTTTVEVKVWIRNADGVVSEPNVFNLTVETSSCT
jgi:hypothetical protein